MIENFHEEAQIKQVRWIRTSKQELTFVLKFEQVKTGRGTGRNRKAHSNTNKVNNLKIGKKESESREKLGPVDVGGILNLGGGVASKKLLPSSQDINQLFQKEKSAGPDKKGPIKIKLNSGAKFFNAGGDSGSNADAPHKLKVTPGSEQENSTRHIIRQPNLNRAGAPIKQGLRMQIKASNVRILSKKESGGIRATPPGKEEN